MKFLLKLIMLIMATSLILSSAYAAPGGNGKGNGNGNRGNHGKGYNTSKSAAQKSNARQNEIKRNIDRRNLRDNRPDGGNRSDKDPRTKGKSSLEKSANAKWFKHPSDDRGQGNNGKPKMLSPYGHDKDSDRKELYGNNGRPIREKESTEDELPNLERVLGIDFSLVGLENEEWIADWYQSTLDWYNTSEVMQQYYTYETWETMWHAHFYPGGEGESVTGIRVGYKDNLDYTLTSENYGSEPLEVTTTLIASEDFSGYSYEYDAETGTWTFSYITVSAGDVVSETTQEVVLDPETGTYTVSAELDEEGVPDQQNQAYFVDMEVSVTDTTTGETTTFTYDKSLYLYRCPYGKVYNKDTNVPIVGAKVTVFFDDGSIVPLDKALNPTASNPQYSDATGRYGAKLQTGRKYYLEVSAEGYENYRSEIFTEKWHVLREDVALTALPDPAAITIAGMLGPREFEIHQTPMKPIQNIEATLIS